MIAAGVYAAKAVEAAMGKTKGGSEQIAVRFEVVPTGESITWFGYFTDKTFERTIDSLRYCGWQGDDLSDMTGLGEKEVQIVVEHDTYEGKTRPKVAWVNAPAGLSLQSPMQEADVKSFAANMRGRILAMKQASGGAQRPASSTTRSTPKSTTRGGVISPEPDYDRLAAQDSADDIPY